VAGIDEPPEPQNVIHDEVRMRWRGLAAGVEELPSPIFRTLALWTMGRARG
jgi:hypothetical protein